MMRYAGTDSASFLVRYDIESERGAIAARSAEGLAPFGSGDVDESYVGVFDVPPLMTCDRLGVGIRMARAMR